MYPRMLGRAAAALGLAASLLVPYAPALAASQLTGVNVSPAAGGGVSVTLSFAGGVPTGWSLTGNNTQTPTVQLPGTTTARSANQFAYAGAGAVSSVSLSSSPAGLTVTLHLINPVQVMPSNTPSQIVLSVGPPLGPPTTPAPTQFGPTGGGFGAGESFEVIPLKYADVSEVVGLLVQGSQVAPSNAFQPEGSIFSLPTSNSGYPTSSSPFSGINATPPSEGERVSQHIGYDRRLNAIVVYGTPEQIAKYKAFIKAVDIPVPSVVLECAVLELDQTAAKNLGIDFTNPNGAVASGGAELGPTNGPNPVGLTASLQASLYADIARGAGKILATPRILALNGEPAQILSGDALPISSTTLTSGSSPFAQSSISYIAVGINLQILPRIDPNGFVTSHIYAEASSVTQYINTGGQEVPEISLRQVNTEATVRNGQPYIIGGLLLDQEITNLSKIPGIGDLPIIGGLFRVRHDTTQRTNLYVIITPHIIRNVGYPNQPLPSLPKMDVPGAVQVFSSPPPAPPSPMPTPPAATEPTASPQP